MGNVIQLRAVDRKRLNLLQERSGCSWWLARQRPVRGEPPDGWPLADLKERVLPIAGIGPDLARPAAQFDGMGPCRADQHVRPVDLVEGAIPRSRMRDLL